MLQYTLRRVITMIPVLIIVGVIIFFLVRMIPGDPAAIMLGSDATQEQVEALSQRMGLDRPLPVQFVSWFGNVLRGDFGDSLHYKQPVTTILAQRLEPTFLLIGYAMAIAILTGIPLGILAALNRGKLVDQLCMFVSMLGISIPSFWLGLNLVIAFSINNSIFPAVGYIPIGEGSLPGALYYLTLPAIALGLQRSASIARVTRSGMLEVLGEDYVRTAKAKGLSDYAVIVRHALRNSMIPVLTQVGMSIAHLAGGSVVVETIFNIPGIGQLAFDSIKRRDYPMIQGHILFVAFLYIAINLIIDLLYKYFDPRIEYN